MTNEGVVRAYQRALDAGDMPAARALMSDEFTHAPAAPGDPPMDAEAFLAAHAQMSASFPDLRRHVTDLVAAGDEVRVTAFVTATHDHVVKLPVIGVGPLEPTGRSYRTAPHHDTFTLRDGLITGVHSTFPPGAGLRGLLDQITTTEHG